MDFTNKKIINTLCEKYDIRPTRLGGQNFLIDKDILNRIVENSNIKKQDNILELGAGFGVLTQELAQKSNNTIAVERDKRLAKHLKLYFANKSKVQIIQKDILSLSNNEIYSYFSKNNTAISDTKKIKRHLNKIEYQKQDRSAFLSDNKILKDKSYLSDTYQLFGAKNNNGQLSDIDYRIIANIPYQITGKILRKFVSDSAVKPQKMHILSQKEVAERICAKPGKMSLLSLSVQLYSKPRILFSVPKTSFWPEPKVDSSFLQINNISASPIYSVLDEKRFWQVVRIGFSSPRKQLQNTLSAGLGIGSEKVKKVLNDIGIDDRIRPQALSIEQWIKLVTRITRE